MSLEIAEREREGIKILDLKGPLQFGSSDLRFRAELEKLAQARTCRVIVNLKDVAHLDTAGLGTLLFALAKMSKAGGRLVLVNLNAAHINLVVLARMEAVFEVFREELDAVNSFFPDRKVTHFDILEFVHSVEPPREPDQ
jgi:anti-sigma B factor antagonist